jgi:hypothetical protein
MKKIIIAAFLGLLATGMQAQNTKGPKIVPVAQAIQNKGFTLQVGIPFLGQNNKTRTTSPVDVRFPWDVLYLYKTFAEESFSVSKGYFGDKVLISWDIRANFDLIKSIKIYKREYSTTGVNPFVFVASVSASVSQYEDKYVEGGVLFEYKVVAEGISQAESLYSTYITGIGYRNPTAIVTGNVSYKGGNPVKDVTVSANSSGTTVNQGASLYIPASSSLKIENLNSPITTAATFQAWLKPKNEEETGDIRLFRLVEGNNSIEANVSLNEKPGQVKVTIGRSVFTLDNYYPAGTINERGDDELIQVADFNKSFVHFTVVINEGKVPALYINGRPITEAYSELANSKLVGVDASYTSPYFAVGIPTETSTFKLNQVATQWKNISVGGGQDSYIDEIRLWKAVVTAEQIRTDYSRYISGNDSRLVAYLRANEKDGQYAYDLSRNGFNYNKNHGNLGNQAAAVSWANEAGNFPTADQLGVLGVTDKNGNYEITAIPYSGTGESFTITPKYGQHNFEPSQQLVFLGQGSEVVNKINFIDKASFIFTGQVLFDSRGVFPSTGTEVSNGIVEGAYNSYDVVGKAPLGKGKYWLELKEPFKKESTVWLPETDYIEGVYVSYESNYYKITVAGKSGKIPPTHISGTAANGASTMKIEGEYELKEYATIFTEGANVYIDGTIVLDANNTPVVTNAEGSFVISVPIGNHYITVKKDGHVFSYNGRFPENSVKEFFENDYNPVRFVDKTRVIVIGKVVGGSVEAAKKTGFGDQGLVTREAKDADGISKTIDVSARNNIGVASFTLGYKPGGSAATAATETFFKTNDDTGEYRVSLLPLQYELLTKDLKIDSNNNIRVIEKTEPLNFSKIDTLKTPVFTYIDGTIEKNIEGKPYHYEKSFPWRSEPTVRVLEQKSDETIKVGNVDISIAGSTDKLYTQFKTYKILMDRFESYNNYDGDTNNPVIVRVPIIDGKLTIDNTFALENSGSLVVDPKDPSKMAYTFKGGLPSITPPFTRTINLKYLINDVECTVTGYEKVGIILGGISDDIPAFVTEAPDMPDIILRDPPGSNSFASIEKGESISFTTESSFADTEGVTSDLTLMAGIKFEIGGGLAGPVIESIITQNLSSGIGVSHSSTDGKSLTKTYTFNQTISTSDDPANVGSMADLYIGNSVNQSYGSFHVVKASTTKPAAGEYSTFTYGNNQELYISKQKAFYFVEKPSTTFFIYSQRHILEVLIPEYELFIVNINNGNATPGEKGVLTIPQYEESIRLWRKLILDNEKNKYLAKNNIAAYKTKLTTVLTKFNKSINEAINAGDAGSTAAANLKTKLAESKKTNDLLDKYFKKNISFDSGVGEYTQSVETSVIEGSSLAYNLTLDKSLEVDLGFTLNEMGFLSTTTGYFQQDINSSLSEESTKTTTVSYTLKDNDKANFLSVDAVNAFDGNGPIFITLAGMTSCPYEGAEESLFYNKVKYDATPDAITELPDGAYKREPLSSATQKVEVPVLLVTVASVSNVSAARNAEFELILENNSAAGIDADFKLVIDNTTNPNNALINIEQNGTIVHVPYGQRVIYKMTLGKSISDVYDYQNIKVLLESLCDGKDVSASVLVSASFVPSCSLVTVSSPVSNWVYNKDVAYNTDTTTKPLRISLSEFSTTFASFKKIDLEYRLASSPNWTRLRSYYKDMAAAPNGADGTHVAIAPGSASLSFLFDIADRALQDGNYEIRAISTCTNNTEYVSDVITGRVDLNSPLRFGTPLPTDGILGAGEDLKVTFNESVFFNSALSKIEIKAQTNQEPIDHNVSLYFEGAANTAVINNPRITTGDLTIEFWMKNEPTATAASIIAQEGGLNISLNNGEMSFTLGGIKAEAAIAKDGGFHHYTFTHKNSTGLISIYQDGKVIVDATGNKKLPFTNNNPLVIGGNSFIGNMHDLRLWNKTISSNNAYAKMSAKLIGNEASLIGYWPMDEGRGTIANDKARYKHAIVNALWDIKPKGTSYEFKDGQYLALNEVGSVVLTKEMDATVSFWMKTGDSQEATLFSNGRGEKSKDELKPFADNWAINMNATGNLTLESEGNSYALTTKSVADNTWHHVTLLFSRISSLRTYVDASQVSSNQIATIGGFSGNKIWLGARGFIDGGGETVDRKFTGKIDEFRLWNTLRNVEQISRDRFNEVDINSIGLLLYARMNKPDPATAKGPRYYHADSNQTVIPDDAVLSSGTAIYSSDVPAIKPERNLIGFLVNRVINKNEMIIEPVVKDWASLEGQVLDITVHKMFDDANNMQQSPITWTAYVKRNEVSWFADGYNEIVDLVKKTAEDKSFDITLINKGGKGQPYAINNVPNWLHLSKTTGTLAPDSKINLTATIDKELTPGEYLENLYLKTDFGYDEKLQIKLRVLAPTPNWAVDPTLYKYSMNIVGRIKVDSKFSEDSYDKIAAFSGGAVRGSTNLVYNTAYQEYFAFLTVYSDTIFSENIAFKIWDASQGKVIVATMNANTTIPFEENGVLGRLSQPAIFENSSLVEQKISFNKGWTWVSMNVIDANFLDLNALTNNLKLETNDRMLTNSPAHVETYFKNESTPSNSGWSGAISANGGLSDTKMIKVYMKHEQPLTIKGIPVAISNWSFPIQKMWNWLPYTLAGNQLTTEALAYFDATDGDVIKSQNLFAIYDAVVGWNGTLKYLESGIGYMLKSSKEQSFKFPSYLSTTAKLKNNKGVADLSQEAISPEFTQYTDNMNAVVLLPTGYNKLFAYDANGVLKGAAENQEINGKALSFITIYGETTEPLVFYIGDGVNKKRTSKSFSFKGNDILGTTAKPIILSEESLDVIIYPNPFDNEITIKVNAVKDQMVSIKLYSVSGQLVLDKTQDVLRGENVLKIEPRVAAGAYVLRIEINGETTTHKVMKN